MNREPTACPSPRNFSRKVSRETQERNGTGTRRRVLVENRFALLSNVRGFRIVYILDLSVASPSRRAKRFASRRNLEQMYIISLLVRRVLCGDGDLPLAPHVRVVCICIRAAAAALSSNALSLTLSVISLFGGEKEP